MTLENEKIHLLSKVSFILCIAIILWGAWVRISGSGDGCGTHWPLCKGELLPSLTSLQTWTEFFHRAKSGAFGLLVLYIFFLGRRSSPSIKNATSYALIFTIIEALLGAKLVLSGLVVNNDSTERIITSALHLVNTSFLLTSLVACIVLSGRNAHQYSFSLSKHTLMLFSAYLIIAVTGSWCALSTQLFPSLSILDGIQKDLFGEHIILRIRIFHPLCAIFCGLLITSALSRKCRDSSMMDILTRVCFPVTLCVGIVTLLTLSPVFLKLIHLFCSTMSCSLLARALMLKKAE